LGGVAIAYFEMGDRVKVTGLTKNGETGKITAKSIRPKEVPGKVAIGREYASELNWYLWQVKLDKSGKLQTFPETELQKIE